MKSRPLLAVSACLLGCSVRYDGGDKYEPWIVEVLGKVADFLPICPEEGIGLGTPRPPIRLAGPPDRPRAQGIADPSLDVTGRLRAYALEMLPRLGNVSGYILKSRSPSCGLRGVKLFADGERYSREGAGIYAAFIAAHLPHLPLVDEEELRDPRLREEFMGKIGLRLET